MALVIHLKRNAVYEEEEQVKEPVGPSIERPVPLL